MPTVPTYNQQVNQAAIGSVRAPTTAGIESFGGGEAAAGPTRALSQSVAIAQEEIKKADEVAITGADTEAAQAKHLYFNELQKLKGEQAFGAKEQLGAKYKADIDKISAKLSNPNQKSAFGVRAKAHDADLNLQIDKHVYAQAQEVDKLNTTASIDTYGNEAVNKLDDTFGHETAINQQKETMAAYAKRNGLSDKAIEPDLRKLEAKTRSQTIDKFLFNDDPKRAKAYFELHKDQFGLEEQKKIKETIDKVSVDQNAQVTVNKLLASGVSQKQGLDEIRKIEDVKLHDETRKRFLNEWSVNEAVKKETIDNIHNGFANQIDRDPNLFETMKKTNGWKMLSIPQRNALEEYAQAKKTRKNIPTDLATWQDLTSMAASPKTREQFLSTNLMDYVNKVNHGDMQTLIKMKNEMLSGDNTKADFIQSREDIVKSTALNAGINYKQNTEEYNKFVRRVDDEIAIRVSRGEKVTNKDVQDITDNLLIKAKLSGTGILWDDTKKLYEMNIDDVPKDAQERYKRELGARKIKADNATMIKLYFAEQKRLENGK